MQPAPPEEQDVLDRPISTLVPDIEAGKSVAHWQQIFEEAEIATACASTYQYERRRFG